MRIGPGRYQIVAAATTPAKPRLSIAELAAQRCRCAEAKRAGRPCTEFTPAPVAQPEPPDLPERYGPVGRRHLAYHLLPCGPWQKSVDALRLRWPLFSGRKVVAVLTGPPVAGQGGAGLLPLSPPDAVRAYLPSDAQVIEIANDPERWELASWPHLWDAVLAGADALDAVLYAHAKGVTRRPEATAQRWAELLYETALDHWPEVERQLRRYPMAGSLLKRGAFFVRGNGVFAAGMERSAWHWSGNVWWARALDLRQRLAATPVPVDRWGCEAWPGLAYPVAEAGLVFGPRCQDFDLYRPAHMAQVEADHRQWLATHPPAAAVLTAPARPRTGQRLSVIVATTGRASLARTLASVSGQLLPGDELLVRADKSGDWGATPRTEGMRQATGDYLLWLDDDDCYLPGALAAVRAALAENPDRPHLFRMRREGEFHDELPRESEVRVGEVSTQMFVAPNDPARLGQWGTRYEGDYDFIASTLALYPPGAVVFRPELLSVWRPDPDGVWSRAPWPRWWSYEPGSWDESAYLETVCRDDYRLRMMPLVGAAVLDIGAHIGSFAQAAKMRGAAVVHCYEPEPVSRGHLVRNAARLRGVAVSDAAVGAVVLDMGQAGRPLPAAAPTVDLDTAIVRLCQEAPRRRVGLLKIDAEGAEWPALSAVTRLDVVDAIAGEWHECAWDGRTWGPADLTALFARHGWVVELAPAPDLEGRGLFFAARKRP